MALRAVCCSLCDLLLRSHLAAKDAGYIGALEETDDRFPSTLSGNNRENILTGDGIWRVLQGFATNSRDTTILHQNQEFLANLVGMPDVQPAGRELWTNYLAAV